MAAVKVVIAAVVAAVVGYLVGFIALGAIDVFSGKATGRGAVVGAALSPLPIACGITLMAVTVVFLKRSGEKRTKA